MWGFKLGWVKPKFSKTRVNKAGKVLADLDRHHIDGVPITEIEDDYEIMSNWCASHAYPMHVMAIHLRRKSSDIDSRAIVVQRLKRAPSIVNKLYNNRSMNLQRMQDIGGCRSVVDSAKYGKTLSETVKNSKTRHVLHREDDYVAHPKESGYRAIHLIYKYNATKKDFKGLFVELQIRSRIQHAWATAVEIVDLFTTQSLKASEGEKDWIKFFQMVSTEFTKLEGTPQGIHTQGIDTWAKMIKLEKKLNALDRLKAFTSTMQFTDNDLLSKRNITEGYVVIEVWHGHGQGMQARITNYPLWQLEQANAYYAMREREAREGSSYDVVMVFGRSMYELKKAYPNYFVDSSEFIKHVRRAMKRGE